MDEIRKQVLASRLGSLGKSEPVEMRFKLPSSIHEKLSALATEANTDVASVARHAIETFVLGIERSIRAKEARARKA